MVPNPTDPKARALPGIPEDWPDRVADRIVDVVGRIRAATDRPTANLARRLVYGMLMATAGVLMFVLSLIGLVRLIDVYLPADVWATYTLLGGFFSVIGLLLWAKRPRRAAS